MPRQHPTKRTQAKVTKMIHIVNELRCREELQDSHYCQNCLAEIESYCNIMLLHIKKIKFRWNKDQKKYTKV